MLVIPSIRTAYLSLLDRESEDFVGGENYGAIFTDRAETPEGLERTFALNHMAYFELTRGLLDVLRASAPARIVTGLPT